MVLTVNEVVVQDAEAYQRLLDAAARADVYEAIRQGIEDIAHDRYVLLVKHLTSGASAMAYLVELRSARRRSCLSV